MLNWVLNRKKVFFILRVLFLFLSFQIPAATLNLNKNRAAKVGDRVFLKSEVQEAARQSKVSYQQALSDLINFEILYLAAKITVPVPEEKNVLEAIKEEKQYYAFHFRREVDTISDQEFLNSIGFQNRTMKEYREYTIKRMMVEQYLNGLYSEAELKNNTTTQAEIDEFIKDNPQIFQKSETYDVMLIYLSFFRADGVQLTKEGISDKCTLAKECLEHLKNGVKFSDAAKSYSEDLYSLKQVPIGYYGKIERDDEYTKKRFSTEILEALSSSNNGLISRLFMTQDGIFIFYMLDKIPEMKITGEDAYAIAMDEVKKRRIRLAKKEIECNTIEKYRKYFGVIIFQK